LVIAPPDALPIVLMPLLNINYANLAGRRPSAFVRMAGDDIAS